MAARWRQALVGGGAVVAGPPGGCPAGGGAAQGAAGRTGPLELGSDGMAPA